MALFTDIYGSLSLNELTHWGWVTHICVSDLTIISSDNGLSPGRCQAIIRTNAGILLIRPLGTNFSEILIEILIFSFKKMRLKVSSAKRRPFCLGLNELIDELVTYEVVWSFLWDSCMMVYLLINADEYCSTTHHNHKKNVKVKNWWKIYCFVNSITGKYIWFDESLTWPFGWDNILSLISNYC